MPRFALLDASGVVVNVVALGRREDFVEVQHHVRDEAGEITLHKDGTPVLKAQDTDEHLVAAGAVHIVEITDETGPATLGMVFPPPKTERLVIPPAPAALPPGSPARLPAPTTA